MKNLDLDQWKEELALGIDSDGISPEKAAGVLGVGALEVMRLMENNELDHVHVFKDRDLTDELFVVIPNYSLKRYIRAHPPKTPEVYEKKDDILFPEQPLMVNEFAAGNADFGGSNAGTPRTGVQSTVSTQSETAMGLNYVDLRKDNILEREKQSVDQPDYLFTNIDPITGNDIDDVEGHPFIQDGNVTIYFESEATKKAYTDMPLTNTPILEDSTEQGLDEK